MSRKIKFFIFLFMLMAQSAFAVGKGVESESSHHVIECMIFDSQGHIVRNYGGKICLFFDDGSFIRSTESTMERVGSDSRTLWTKSIHSHHQINAMSNKNTFLVIGSSFHRFAGKKDVRFDRLITMDMNGNELASFDFFKHRNDLKRRAGPNFTNKPFSFWKSLSAQGKDIQLEWSHVNSFYEIPANTSLHPAFKAGNFIVNANGLGTVLVLDKELKKILWSQPQSRCRRLQKNSYHDVQVIPSGLLLIYNNRGHEDCESTTIDLFNPVSLRTDILYRGTENEKFYSQDNGGAQILSNENILLSDRTFGGWAYEISKGGHKVWALKYPHVDPETGMPYSFQQIKRLDLSEFLKKNTGL